MTSSRPDPLDVMAGHLASGHSAGLPAADRRRLDRVRALLTEAAMWSNPSPALLEQAAAGIQAMRYGGLHAATGRHSEPP